MYVVHNTVLDEVDKNLVNLCVACRRRRRPFLKQYLGKGDGCQGAGRGFLHV